MDLVAGSDLVVVLSFNGRDDTLECVASIVEGDPDVAVLVIDNGSFDGVLNEVVRRWPSVATLQTGRNLGFAGGMNVGITWGLDREARTITVLNNDTVAPPGMLTHLAKECPAGPAVSPLVTYPDGAPWFGGGTVDAATTLARHLNEAELATLVPADADLFATDVLAGCCLTAHASTWRQVGLFDERFFLNFEDSEWSLRARRLGVRLLVDRRVSLVHKVSRSFTGAMAGMGLFYYTRNGLLFGRGVRGSGLGQRARLLRRHVVPAVVGKFRSGPSRDGVRSLGIVNVAVSAHAIRRYGRAPAWLERAVLGR